MDLIRRVNCFGACLFKLDIRQESQKHKYAITDLLDYLELGDYSRFTEEQKQAFLIDELKNKRFLLPDDFSSNAQVQEILDAFKLVNDCPRETLGGYNISI